MNEHAKQLGGYKILSSCTCGADTSGVIVHPSSQKKFCKHITQYRLFEATDDINYTTLEYKDSVFEYKYQIEQNIYTTSNLNSLDGLILFHYYKHCNPNVKHLDKQYRNNLMTQFIKIQSNVHNIIKTSQEISKQVNNLDKSWSSIKNKFKGKWNRSTSVRLICISNYKTRIAKPDDVNYNRMIAANKSDKKAHKVSKKIINRASVLLKYNHGTKYVNILYIINRQDL